MALNLPKIALRTALVVVALYLGLSGPALAQPPQKSSQRAVKETPYSNAAVQRQREIVRALREAERTSRSGYKFKATGRRETAQ